MSVREERARLFCNLKGGGVVQTDGAGCTRVRVNRNQQQTAGAAEGGRGGKGDRLLTWRRSRSCPRPGPWPPRPSRGPRGRRRRCRGSAGGCLPLFFQFFFIMWVWLYIDKFEFGGVRMYVVVGCAAA